MRDRIAHYLACLEKGAPCANSEAPFSLDAFLEMLERHCSSSPDVLFEAGGVCAKRCVVSVWILGAVTVMYAQWDA